MGKGHQKYVKQEKAKVKLKTTKTYLPKGQNVTNVNFKVKKVVIRDQLKQHGSEDIVSRRNLTLQELLVRLGHYSTGVKLEAVKDLIEVVNGVPQAQLDAHLAKLTEDVAKLCLDLVHDVRREATKCLALVLSKVRQVQLISLFPSLLSYVLCGLTHIDRGIKEDGLGFLDVLLNASPLLCAQSQDRLLPITLNLVSDATSSTRALSLALDSKLTSDKWRARVLSRVKCLLQAVLQDMTGGLKVSQKSAQVEVEWTGQPLYLPCYRTNILQDSSEPQTMTVSYNLEQFTESLLPLLLDAFLEMVPLEDKSKSGHGANIEVEAAAFLDCIVTILLLLLDIHKASSQSSFLMGLKEKYGARVMSHLVDGRFPYQIAMQANLTNKQRKAQAAVLSSLGSGGVPQPACFRQNLAICQLILYFAPSTQWKPAISYIKNCFRAAHKLDETSAQALATCVDIAVRHSPRMTAIDLIGLAATHATDENNSAAQQLHCILTKIALNPTLTSFHYNSNFQNWLHGLPKKLLQNPISKTIVEDISTMSLRPSLSSLIKALDESILDILEFIPKAKFDGLDESKGALLLTSVLYRTKSWSRDKSSWLLDKLLSGFWNEPVAEVIKNVLTIKLELDREGKMAKHLSINKQLLNLLNPAIPIVVKVTN